jgi:hypothetical protein
MRGLRGAGLVCGPAVKSIRLGFLAPLTGLPILAQTEDMVGDRIPSLILQAFDELRARGVVITSLNGEWCVNYRNSNKAMGYFTDDLQDALEHGRGMAAACRASPPEPEKRPPARQKRRRPMSVKAQRRRMIRAHNRRMRGRVLKRSARK